MKRAATRLSLTIVVSLLAMGSVFGTSAPEAVKTKPAAKVVDMHSSRTSLDWNGTYKGVVPCADCEGIETEISLGLDMTYTIRTRYLGKGDQKALKEKGKFSWDEAGSVITLLGIQNGPTKYQVGENHLTQLDLKGNRIVGPLAKKYVLTKE
jgi:uncharacterized lipoprotein NlpE involved in copper resistance